MRLLQYMGKHHIAWCNWQGHSNGWTLRIGFKKKDVPQIVFYISWFRFYFYVCKTEIGAEFRYIRLLSHGPIYFSSKNTRTIESLRTRLIATQNQISDLYRKYAALNDAETKCDKRMRELHDWYANTIRLDEDYQFEERVEVSMKEELFGHEFRAPRQKRLITFKK